MANDEKRRFDLPWGTLLPVLAALAGVIASFKPLVSPRPPASNEKPLDIFADQDVDARLWQDPFAAAQKGKAALEADLAAKRIPETRARTHQLGALVERLRRRSSQLPGKTMLLGVMLDAGPYVEQAEARLRARRAVLEGLSESGFVPTDAEHIGFLTVPWPIATPYLDEPQEPVVELLLPWEECRAIDAVQEIHPRDTTRVIVLWLPASNFNPRPFGRLASLLDASVGDLRPHIDVKLIGPANSTGLQAMVREVATWDRNVITRRDEMLNGVTMISARATASNDELLYDLPRSDPVPPEGDTVESRIESAFHGRLKFIRTITPDDQLLRAAVDELKTRGLKITEKNDHVVILSEWDSTYGRSLPTTFKAQALGLTTRDALAKGESEASPVHTYRYMHGIDGRLPGDRDSGNAQQARKGGSDSQEQRPVEATEGLDQSDFLRRLARQLKQEDAARRRIGQGRIRAIGLLGSDVFDKVMILRALRPEFPDAIFFTNVFDTYFERADAWDDAHNLVIASPFGGALPSKWQKHIGPYRDSTQTSMFAGTLVATGVISEEEIRQLTRETRLFEIGRRGAHELLTGASKTRPFDGIRDPFWFRHWLASPGVLRNFSIAIVTGVLLAIWISRNVSPRRRANEREFLSLAHRMARNTALWVICGVPIVIVGVAGYAQSGAAAEEPLAFLAGVSIWPTEMVRLVAFVLAVHFMIKASLDLRMNEADINDRYCLQRAPRGGGWRAFRAGLSAWERVHRKWLLPDARFTADEAWQAYLLRNQFWPRFARVCVLLVIYILFLVALVALFPGAVSAPARGQAAFHFNFWVMAVSTLGMMILTFYVVDAIKLNSNFIRVFTRGVTTWAPAVSARCGRVPPLTGEEISRYHDITFVADRSEVVARLIWYPLIVLALMLFARASYFDNWTWPANLLIIFSFYAAWALGSAAFLRRSAEQLRDTCLQNLQELRLANYKDAVKQKAFDEMIAEVRSLKKGAFAPLSEQPFIRAILVPTGGFGLLAVVQRLLDAF